MTGLALILWRFACSPLGRWIAGALAVLAAIGGFYWWAFHKGVSHEAPKVIAAQQQARDATVQTVVTVRAAQAADLASTTAQVATAKAQEGQHAVQAVPGASAPVDPAVLASWRAQRCRVLNEPASAPDCAGGRQPAGKVPAGGR